MNYFFFNERDNYNQINFSICWLILIVYIFMYIWAHKLGRQPTTPELFLYTNTKKGDKKTFVDTTSADHVHGVHISISQNHTIGTISQIHRQVIVRDLFKKSHGKHTGPIRLWECNYHGLGWLDGLKTQTHMS